MSSPFQSRWVITSKPLSWPVIFDPWSALPPLHSLSQFHVHSQSLVSVYSGQFPSPTRPSPSFPTEYPSKHATEMRLANVVLSRKRLPLLTTPRPNEELVLWTWHQFGSRMKRQTENFLVLHYFTILLHPFFKADMRANGLSHTSCWRDQCFLRITYGHSSFQPFSLASHPLVGPRTILHRGW